MMNYPSLHRKNNHDDGTKFIPKDAAEIALEDDNTRIKSV